MCGIAGFYNSNRKSSSYYDLSRNMLAHIHHRGPDEIGVYINNSMSMGVARLSIIDLLSGQQPISDISGRYSISYNGEVYNYVELRSELQKLGYEFRTNSDTEVVLYAWIHWKENCFIKFNGAFALAIYDKKLNKLILARDRYGKKPLFYAERKKELVFASEMKCFLAHPLIDFKWDLEQLSTIYTTWTPLPHQSSFKGINQLPMGTYLVAENGNVSLNSYHSLDFSPKVPFSGSLDDAILETQRQLSESVNIRLRSDVEVGTYLSGGLDSAIITLLSAKHSSHKIKTFSISFDSEEYNERKEQELLVRHLNTDHTDLFIRDVDIANNFPEAIWYSEMPVFRTAFVPMYLLSKNVNKCGIKVVLTGEGADEIFLGYNIFKETLLRSTWNDNISTEEKKNAILGLYPYLRHYGENNIKPIMGTYAQYSVERNIHQFSHELRFANGSFSTNLLSNHHEQQLPAFIKEHESEIRSMSPIEKAQWLEFKTLLPGYLLSTQGDRMVMANSVENRCPFLDFNVVDYAASLPQEMKLSKEWEEKYILKKAFAHKLPREIVNRAKKPYRAPDIISFLHLNNKVDYLDVLLSESEISHIDSFNKKFVMKFVNKMYRTPAHKVSPRENQAFIFLLSTALLDKTFVRGEYSRPPDIENIVTVKIDER